MLRELFVNITILVSFIFIVFMYFKNTPLSHESTTKVKYLVAVFGGILGTLLMIYSLNDKFIAVVDLKFIPIVMAAFFVGMFPAIFSAIIISFVILVYLGINTYSLMGGIIMIGVAIGCGFISKLQLKEWKKWALMCSYSMIFITIRFAMLFKNNSKPAI